MTDDEFLTESIAFIKKEFSSFNEIKNVMNEIFVIFHNLCKTYKFSYFLGFGSLLGKVRDGGTIPWDFDTDVFMPYNQIGKFSSLLRDKLPKEYFYISNFTSDEFPCYEMRIGKVGYPIEYVHFDIFYLVGAPDDDKKIEKFRMNIRKIFDMRMSCVYKRKKYDVKSNQSKIKYFLIKMFHLMKSKFMPLKLIDKKFLKLINKYSYNTSKNLCSISWGAYSYHREDIEPIKNIVSSDCEFCCPNNPDRVLNIWYKNYKEYLPIDNRFDDFYQFMKKYNESKGKYIHIDYNNLI